jgi:hypothetical protein
MAVALKRRIAGRFPAMLFNAAVSARGESSAVRVHLFAPAFVEYTPLHTERTGGSPGVTTIRLSFHRGPVSKEKQVSPEQRKALSSKYGTLEAIQLFPTSLDMNMQAPPTAA